MQNACNEKKWGDECCGKDQPECKSREPGTCQQNGKCKIWSSGPDSATPKCKGWKWEK